MSNSVSILSRLRRDDTRAFFACWVLFAFLLHALVPVGFMPDLKALQQGVVKIVICTAQGSGSLFVDKDGQPAHAPQHDKAKKDVCPFGAAPQTALLAFFPSYLPALFIVSESNNTLQELFLAARPLGISQPRAPPVS
jgi:hypothetical protein